MIITLIVLLQVLAGWFVADLFSAFVHITVDYADYAGRWPIVGPLVRSFQLHHRQPSYFLQHGFWYSSREVIVGGILAFLLFVWWWPWFAIAVGFGVAASQESHRWAHRERKPRIVRILQRMRIMLWPPYHDHHHNNFSRSFGILNGWSNSVVNAMLWLGGW